MVRQNATQPAPATPSIDGYERELVKVHLDTGEQIPAHTYIATAIDHTLRPYEWYKQHVVRGALANRLAPEYIAAISSVLAQADPDRERHAREMGLYG